MESTAFASSFFFFCLVDLCFRRLLFGLGSLFGLGDLGDLGGPLPFFFAGIVAQHFLGRLSLASR